MQREVGWETPEGGKLAQMLESMGYTSNETRELRNELKTLRLRWLEPGDILIREGEAGDASYIGLSGKLGVYKKLDAGGEARVAQVGPGTVQGEIAVLSGLPRFATVRAEEASEVFVFDVREFRKLLDASMRFREHVDALLVARLKELPAG